MKNFTDKWGRYHHKEVTDANPVPSNNGWIYTAYAYKLDLPLDWLMLGFCYRSCRQLDSEFTRMYLIRSPDKFSPPISRDEVLGMAALGFLRPQHLDGWSFCPYKIPAFNPIKTIQQFMELRGKHRNYLWQNKLEHTYRFAFSVPLSDRHFILQKWGKFNIFYWAIAKVDSLLKITNGIGWLKYDKNIEAMKSEFPDDHPFNKL
jgi:hypothetical protein